MRYVERVGRADRYIAPPSEDDPDPRVRQRAQALLLVAQGHSAGRAVKLLGTAAHRVRAWRERYVER